MITKLCEFNHRSECIIEIIQNELLEQPNQQIMVLAHNKNLLIYLYKAIEYRNIASVGYYLGGMKEHDLKASESKQIIIATYAMAAEGLDIKQLNTIVFATPMTNVVQAVGRILRKVHPDIVPEIYDIVDNFSSFINQSIKRRRFYCKEKYSVYCPPVIHSCEAACTAIDSLSALRIQKYSKRRKKNATPKCLFLQE